MVRMTNSTLTIPPVNEIIARQRACREELLALKRLEKLARAAEAAREARQHHEIFVERRAVAPSP